jgi:hypothetical protein
VAFSKELVEVPVFSMDASAKTNRSGRILNMSLQAMQKKGDLDSVNQFLLAMHVSIDL